MSIKPWVQTDSKNLAHFRIFEVRADTKVSPRTGEQHQFYVIDCVDWVNVIAVTPDEHLVMVEQYRHGTNTVELEIPGGVMDVGDESPLFTGTRELREETGYEGEHVQILGRVYPNPAIMSNTCYTVLVQNCTLKHPTSFDHGEDIITRLVPIKEVPGLMRDGQIRHSLVVAALYHFDLWRNGNSTV